MMLVLSEVRSYHLLGTDKNKVAALLLGHHLRVPGVLAGHSTGPIQSLTLLTLVINIIFVFRITGKVLTQNWQKSNESTS